MVYFDGIHLVAENIDELHSFALLCGLKCEWFQNHKRHPHYDVWGNKNKRAVFKNGAIEVSSKELINLTHFT